MKEATTYPCPNCGGKVTFRPAQQTMQCDYCASVFSLDTFRPSASAATDTGHLYGYDCPACGAEVITDSTTAATHCFYCQNPITIQSRLSGEFKPDTIIPFSIDKETAKSRFLEWISKKKYVPKDFFSEAQLEKITGVYFPFWYLDCAAQGALSAKGKKTKTWRAGNHQYTETSYFKLEREGEVLFDQIIKGALQKSNKVLVESIQPYDIAGAKAFISSYLSGFQAEKRDIQQESIWTDLNSKLQSKAKEMLVNTTSGYHSVTYTEPVLRWHKKDWRYFLLPVWVLTYKEKETDKIYYFAMNGQTGKPNGEVPLNQKKLRNKALLISGIILGISALLAGGSLLWL